MITETATIHRYKGHDEGRFGIRDGTLVACTEADYDEEKVCVWFTLPDLRNPECSAYLHQIGPELATIEITERAEHPYGMKPADPAEVATAVAAAEAEEKRVADLFARPDIAAALAVMAEAGVTAEQYAATVEARSGA